MDGSPQTTPRYFIRLSPRLPMLLGLVVTVLLILHVGVSIYHYKVQELNPHLLDLLDVDQESNIPTWWSETTLVLTCGLLLAIASAKRRQKDRDARLWLGLTVIYGVVALDENASLHEFLNTFLHRTFRELWLTWVLPALVLVTVFACAYLRFWWRLPPRPRWLVAASAVMFVSGAAGVDYVKTLWLEDWHTLAGALMTAVEKALQLYGEALFVYALVLYMRESARGPLSIDIETKT